MKTMAMISPAKGRIELQELEISDPSADEIQVRVQASLISPGTERAMILNLNNTPGQFPFEPGYCAAGYVEKIGVDVLGFTPGDRVACFLIGHRQLGNVTAKWAVPVPKGISFELASFLALGQIALQGVRKTRVELGERVLVLGLGIIGQLALQMARLSGGMPVLGADRVALRLQIALECGAEQVLDTSQKNWLDQTGKLAVVIESTGAPEGVPLAFQAADSFARVSLLGSTRGDSVVNFYRDVHRKGITVLGAHAMFSVPQVESHAGFWNWRDDADCFMRLLESGKLSLDPLLTEVVDWQKAEDVFMDILKWNTERVGTVIRWGSSVT